MPNDRSTRWLTVRQFADELGVSISTAYKWSAAGTNSGRSPATPSCPTGRSASAATGSTTG